MAEADDRVWRQAVVWAVLAIGGAFWAAWVWQDSGWLSPVPPATAATPDPVRDVAPGREIVLYQSAYSAWAATFLLIPAYAAFFFRNRTPQAWRVWEAFWTVGYVAFLIHIDDRK